MRCCKGGDMATLIFAKENKDNPLLFNKGFQSKQYAIISLTDKVIAQILTGNYKIIEDSLPRDSKIIEVKVMKSKITLSIYILIESKHFKVIKPKEKYPVLSLLYKRKN